jgi:carboxy-cis,cis-muconate cyclase
MPWLTRLTLLLLIHSLVAARRFRIAIGTFESEYHTAIFDGETNKIIDGNSYNDTNSTGYWLLPNAERTLLYSPKTVWAIDNLTLTPFSNTNKSEGLSYLALTRSNFYSIGNDFLEAWSLNAEGGLGVLLRNVSFGSPSYAHGVNLSPDGKTLYVPDIRKNVIHTFGVEANGNVTIIGAMTASEIDAGPRHLDVHPNGKYVYVINEHGNTVDVFRTGTGSYRLIYSSITLHLLPAGKDHAKFYSCEIVVSPDTKFLFATVRSRETEVKGFLWAFSLDAEGVPSTTPLFMIETPTAGGGINTITVKEESEGNLLIALTDADIKGFYIYRFEGNNITLLTTSREYDQGCCSNVAWLD